MAHLYGWALPTQATSKADHTYVTSSDGCIWPCWGSSNDGNKIAEASGSSRQAGYMSHNDSHAGIEYGLTGVCHQTANRILYFTGRTVEKAKGYAVSLATYGTYGVTTQDWQNRINNGQKINGDCNGENNCCNPVLGEVAITETPLETLIADLAQELQLLINLRLGSENIEDIVEKLLNYQSVLQIKKYSLCQDFLNNAITPERYANAVNQLINEFLQESAVFLKTENYRKLFNLDPNEQIQIVDPEIMKNVYFA